MPKTANSVDEYLNMLAPVVRKTLESVRKSIKSAAPDADEIIGYRIPLYKYNGHLTAFFAAKSHCSFVTMSSNVIKTFKTQLKPYKVSGTTIHFPLDKPLPAELVKKIVKARVKENEAIRSSKKKKAEAKTK